MSLSGLVECETTPSSASLSNFLNEYVA
ncbi:MAG: hypothetical protein QG570_748, partial [Patescibacteria group bacterium]|nr:hypothetical protein [Patescibacteria group bacterium]